MKLRKFQPSSRMKKLLILLGVVLVLIIVQPFIWTGVRRSSERYHDNQTQEEQLVRVEEKIGELSAVFRDNETAIDRLNLTFPTSGNTPEIVASLEKLADQRSIDLTVSSITEGTNKYRRPEQLTPLTIRFDATSTSVASLYSYLDAVEHSLLLADLVVLDMRVVSTPIQGGSGLAQRPYQLSAEVVFYLKDSSFGQLEENG